ncbi:carboxypeptidase-like regulatory domain-containing protein [Fulvivirgaceae bacterium PWU4]|uniref:Carboxypeptidase-like regulatory domain-containing protein n=1 Tax=Chryseosolibacter histidini TaxID=2782349 RepID=A0AAP2GR25_9BACT|nr:carboxypeptidase-like regulatory domain-containing protein [Chryseosolibacter histidini]MBT1699580.1 carboxypeptidase-like regulatory domain-containing protein [Chryseosolibacter histidini]
MKKLLFILVIALPVVSRSQNLTISARIQDKETGEALGFASVGVKGVAIGTISNEQGEFDFHVPPENRNDILVVSMLGYRSFEAPIWTLAGIADQVITLDKSPIELQEIVVSDTLTGGDILGIALSRIEQNYPMEPFLMDGFYRDIKKVGGTYISLLEAAVQIYDENYSEPRNKYRLRERVKLLEVRKSIGYESKFTHYFDQINLLEDLLLHNDVRYRKVDLEGEVVENAGREKNSFYDGHAIYVVTYDKEYKLKVYIDKEDFSIIHLELEDSTEHGYLGKKKNLISKYVGLKKTLDFRRYQGKMYPNYITVTSRINWYDAKTDEIRFETELFQQLLINRVRANSAERIGSTERMRNYSLQYQDQPYNKKFWENYNVIKETPLDTKILADLEKLAPLEKQFEEY